MRGRLRNLRERRRREHYVLPPPVCSVLPSAAGSHVQLAEGMVVVVMLLHRYHDAHAASDFYILTAQSVACRYACGRRRKRSFRRSSQQRTRSSPGEASEGGRRASAVSRSTCPLASSRAAGKQISPTLRPRTGRMEQPRGDGSTASRSHQKQARLSPMCEHSRVWLQPNSSDRRCGKEASSRAPNSDPCDGSATRRARPHFYPSCSLPSSSAPGTARA